jgi:hypothetical protein
MFPVVTVPDTAALLSEQLGSKHKFWFQHESSLMYLFKEARSGTDVEIPMPIGWTPFAGIGAAVDVFVGYLMLDAWIGNTDRHHENWGLVVHAQGTHLAPSYDHAASLGAHETEENRHDRLTTRDTVGLCSAMFLLMLDPQNPYDPSAVTLRTADPALLIGYCPRFLTVDVLHLLQTVPATVHVAVERVNRDAPLQLRLLCSLTADWPDSFQPCSDTLYEPLA